MSKKKWLCPECNSDNIYYCIGATSGPMLRDANLLQISGIGAVALDVYVCGDCGAVRTFVSERDALQQITEKWLRLTD